MSVRWSLCQRQKKLFKLRSLSFFSPIWSDVDIVATFAWYKSFAICTYKIILHRLVVYTNKQQSS